MHAPMVEKAFPTLTEESAPLVIMDLQEVAQVPAMPAPPAPTLSSWCWMGLTRGKEAQPKGPCAPPAAARSRGTRFVAAAQVAEQGTMGSARSPKPLTVDPGTAPSAWRDSDSRACGM